VCLHIVRACISRTMMGMASRIPPPFKSGLAGRREKVEGDGPGLVPSPILPRSEENKTGSECVQDRERSENRQRVKGLGVVGGVAGLGGSGGSAARIPAVGLLAAGLFPVPASPRSGLDTSVPGTNVWR
jgi:hypothetical protein